MRSRRFFALILLLLLITSSIMGQKIQQREFIDIDVYYRHGPWIMAPEVMDGTDFTRSIFYSVERAINPRTGEPYDKTQPSLPCAAKDISHSFRLEKKEFLLGEPILIEHRIELNGPGSWLWKIGGNYRARGRDDNYFFVLQHADGSIVPDIERPIKFFEGGLYSSANITEGDPVSYWLSLQRYSAITEPGAYDLYCLTGQKGFEYGDLEARDAAVAEKIPGDNYIDGNGFLIDRATGKQSKLYDYGVNIHYLDKASPPLIDLLPPEVLAFAKKQSFGLPNDDDYGVGVVSHFKITIRQGTGAEREQMVKRLTRAVKSLNRHPLMGSYYEALLDGIWYAKQPDFLPLLERWMGMYKASKLFESPPLHLDGLAMKPDDASFSLLLKAPPSEMLDSFNHLYESRIASAIPLCIDWLTHEDPIVRSKAEHFLGRWAGQTFKHVWEGYDWERPTLTEGKVIQPLWRAWWEKNQDGFQPRPPCDFPCLKSEK